MEIYTKENTKSEILPLEQPLFLVHSAPSFSLQIFQRFGVSLLPSLGLQPFPAPEGFVVEPMTSGAHFGGRTHGDLGIHRAHGVHGQEIDKKKMVGFWLMIFE